MWCRYRISLGTTSGVELLTCDCDRTYIPQIVLFYLQTDVPTDTLCPAVRPLVLRPPSLPRLVAAVMCDPPFRPEGGRRPDGPMHSWEVCPGTRCWTLEMIVYSIYIVLCNGVEKKQNTLVSTNSTHRSRQVVRLLHIWVSTFCHSRTCG